jgi:hypothetical protein
MLIDIDPRAAPYVWHLLREHFGRLRRNGKEPPPELVAFADALVKTADRNVTRARELAAARNRRYRARLRAQRQSLSA